MSFDGLSYQAAGPLGTQAITTDGSTGWAETTAEYTNPEAFTVLAWFKTSSLQGAIAGFGNSEDPVASSPGDSDRLLWVDPSGKLVWAVYDSGDYELTSTSAVDTGSWVFAAASVGSSGTALYVNGTKVASSSSVTAAQSYSGWWSIGYASLAGWADIPTSYYFKGSVAQVAIIPSQLSSTQISNLYADSTLSTYSAGVSALSPVNYWALNDSGSVPFVGTVPGTAASACSTSEVTVQTTVGSTNTCVYPPGAGACAAPTSANLVTGLGTRSITAPVSGTPVSVTITLKLSTASPVGVLGLHELADISFGTSKSSWSAHVAYPSAWSQL